MTARIAIFVPSMRGGGAERMMFNLAGGLVERGYAVDLVLVRGEGAYLARLPAAVQVIDLKSSGVFASLPALVSYLRRSPPDVMLAAMTHTGLTAIAARWLAQAKMRLVVSERNNLSESVRDNPSIKTRLFPILARLLYPSADAITAVSRGVAQDFAQQTHLPEQSITVIYNPTVTPQLLSDAAQPVTHPWLMDKQFPVILCAGRLVEQKGFATMLRAFQQVNAALPSRLIILGEGEKRAELEALVQTLGLQGSVDLPGFAENPFAYMRHADLFVLSSQYEGFPNVLVEAMACGCPVVSTNCPDGPFEILDGGRYGRLVPVGDADALAQAIIATLRQPPPPTLLSQRAQQFSVDNITSEYLSVLLL